MAHALPALPYAFDALEPHIDAQTMQIHHGKHHQAYINNLNAALEKFPELQGKPVEDRIDTGVEVITKANMEEERMNRLLFPDLSILSE